MITEFANDAIVVVQDGRTVFANPACNTLIGRPVADMAFKTFFEVDENTRIDPTQFHGLGQTILVVDDVASQREITCQMLKQLGYHAEAVSSGEAAVDFVKDHQADLPILDMIMDPGIDGQQTYERIKKFRAEQKAIIVSGFAETEQVKKRSNGAPANT